MAGDRGGIGEDRVGMHVKVTALQGCVRILYDRVNTWQGDKGGQAGKSRERAGQKG